jgi:hypothetical protein
MHRTVIRELLADGGADGSQRMPVGTVIQCKAIVQTSVVYSGCSPGESSELLEFAYQGVRCIVRQYELHAHTDSIDNLN